MVVFPQRFRDQLVDMEAGHGVWIPAENTAGGGIGFDDGAVAVGQDDGVEGVVVQQAVLGFVRL